MDGLGSPQSTHVLMQQLGALKESPASALHGVLAALEGERDAMAERAVELAGRLSMLEGQEAVALCACVCVCVCVACCCCCCLCCFLGAALLCCCCCCCF